MNTSHGGKRSGAGRPMGSKASHTLEAQELRKYLILEFQKNKKQIVSALIKKSKKGEIAAIKELLDRTLGKAKGEVDLNVQSGFSLVELLEAVDEKSKL